VFIAKPLHQVSVRDVQAFGASLIGAADSTIAARLTGVKSLIGCAHRLGYLSFDVGAPVQLPSIEDKLAERIMTEFHVQSMFLRELRPRNAALLRLIYGAGLRISEACALTWRNLIARDDSGQVTIFGKGGKTRIILLAAPLWVRIDALRGTAGPDTPVFRSRQGGWR
jgi:integrase/recombinase XerD